MGVGNVKVCYTDHDLAAILGHDRKDLYAIIYSLAPPWDVVSSGGRWDLSQLLEDLRQKDSTHWSTAMTVWLFPQWLIRLQLCGLC